MPKKPPTLSSSSRIKKDKNSDDNSSDTDDVNINERRKQIRIKEVTDSDESHSNLSADEDVNSKPLSSVNKRSINVEKRHEDTPQKPSVSPTNWFQMGVYGCIVLFSIVVIAQFLSSIFDSSSKDDDYDWRSKIDPNNSLPNDQQITIRASLKPILDKSSTREEDKGVSTLLILSTDEENAAKLARCLLGLINKRTNKDQVSTEIDLHSHRGGKLTLDSNLRTLLNTADDIRAVLLRNIDNIPSKDAFEQLRLLFAYCDGENPVIPHRLIIMTASSNSENDRELRENFKTRWPTEHDFIDALMARISGHTLYLNNQQTSIC